MTDRDLRDIIKAISDLNKNLERIGESLSRIEDVVAPKVRSTGRLPLPK